MRRIRSTTRPIIYCSSIHKYDLFSLIRIRKFSILEIKYISKQISDVFKYLHSRNIIRSDI